MAAFSQHIDRVSRRAQRTVTLAPSGFADDWEQKPTEPVEIGLRLLSEADLAAARSVGVQKACELHPELDERSEIWIEAFNQALMHWAIARGTCKPESIEQPFWEMAEDVVPLALSEGGAARLYGELELLTVLESPVIPEIDEEGLTRLAELLTTGALWEGKSVVEKRRLARLLSYVLELGDAVTVEVTG